MGEEPHDRDGGATSARSRSKGHTPPIPAELMAGIYQGYERRKERTGRIDFEDMLLMAVRLFDDHLEAAEEVRRALRAPSRSTSTRT